MADIDKGCGRVRSRTARRWWPAGRTLVRVPRARKVLGAATVAFAVMCGACTPTSGGALFEDVRGAGQHGAVIVVGSFDFPESVLLADIYGGGLAAHGFRVRILPGLGTRELVDPALMSGLIQVVPEYSGSALQFISLGRLPPTSGIGSTSRALTKLVAAQGLVAGRPATAQDANAIVVTAATAARYDLRSIADLARVAPRLVFGGPPECPGRSYCLPGLRRTYGLHFSSFVPLDAGGPLTLQALEAGDIGVALLFTTDPAIPARHLVVLADSRGLQPAENITPLVRRAAVARHGRGLMAVLNTVSARLGTASLRALNARVQIQGQNPRQVAEDWLRAQGLAPRGRAYR